MASLVIFDFDGTLFDTHESISQTIRLTFDTLLPSHTPPQDEIHRMIASGAGLTETFTTLHPYPEEFTPTVENEWVEQYRALYTTHGQALVKAFPGAKELLTQLNALEIPIAIVSNKGVAAVKTALERNGLEGLVPEELIVGDKTPGAKRKPDPSSFVGVLTPALQQKYGVRTTGQNVLVVGDTIADIEFARNIGRADFVVDSLEDVVGIVKDHMQ
ncbi:unnamed protein product [Penicillium bialowiezense]